jgi:hypothetical protein
MWADSLSTKAEMTAYADSLEGYAPAFVAEELLLQQMVLTLRMRADGDSLSAEQIGELIPIALSCPIKYGTGVFLARSMLNAVDSLSHQSWENECELAPEPISERRGEEPSHPKKFQSNKYASAFAIYPNPTNGRLTIACSFDGKGELTIHSTDGKGVFGPIVVTCNSTIDLASVNSGLYFVRIIESNGSIYHAKLVVNRTEK